MAADVRAWDPGVPGISEVLHARFTDHAYPPHVHDTWTLLVVDEGMVRYDLDRHEHGSVGSTVTVLPPDVAHTGRSATPAGFRKRVLYLDTQVITADLVGAAVGRPTLDDALLRRRIDQLHACLGDPSAQLETESRLALVGTRIARHLRDAVDPTEPVDHARRTADDLRDLLDEHLTDGISLRAAAGLLDRSPTRLVREFTAAFGLPPHRYLTGRRVLAARRRLLAGEPIADVAVAVGFHDQAHLHRHFTRFVGTTPGRLRARP